MKQEKKQKKRRATSRRVFCLDIIRTMAKVNNNNNGNNDGGTLCQHSLIHLSHLARTERNTKQSEMKKLYVNSFAGLDHEELYTHLTKFYEIASTLGALEDEEELAFLPLFI